LDEQCTKNFSVIIESVKNGGKINLINFEERDNTKLIICKTVYGKHNFTEVSKNLARYRSENNFIY